MRYANRCKVPECTSKGRRRGLCKKHYKIWRNANPEPNYRREKERTVEIPVNRYRCAWESRKKSKSLAEAWENLADFAKGVHPKPGRHYRLCKLRPKEPYGPDNFVWRPQVKRLIGESMTDYALRLRIEQLTRFPDFERDRMLMRNYPDQYERMLKDQNYGCAICQKPETGLDRNRKVKKLAVDHCHESKMIRGLLCFDCNVSLGRLGESVERLEAMIRYIKKHAKPDLRVIQGVG